MRLRGNGYNVLAAELRRYADAPTSPGGGNLRNGTAAVLAIAVVATGLVPIFQYETEFNEPYIFVFRHFAIAVLLAVYIIPFVWRRWLPGLKLVVVPAILGVMCLLWASPFFLWPNALLGAQRSEMVAGQVIDRFVAGAKYKSYVVAIEREEQHDTVRLRVPKATFDTVLLGSDFRREMTRGSFGLLYRRK